jgi:hypothetical protein
MKKERGKWVKQDIKSAAKATLGYNAHRVDKEKERMERVLFGNGGKLSEEQALQMIDDASQKTYFFRLILSPDPKSENKDKTIDQWKLTQELVQWLQLQIGREISFVAAEHAGDTGHTDIAHIHAILLIERFGREKMITVPMIDQMRELAAGKALAQQQGREQARPLEPQPDRQPAREVPPVHKQQRTFLPRLQEWEPAIEPLDLVACGNCGHAQSPHTKDGWRKCLSCGEELSKGIEEGLSL